MYVRVNKQQEDGQPNTKTRCQLARGHAGGQIDRSIHPVNFGTNISISELRQRTGSKCEEQTQPGPVLRVLVQRHWSNDMYTCETKRLMADIFSRACCGGCCCLQLKAPDVMLITDVAIRMVYCRWRLTDTWLCRPYLYSSFCLALASVLEPSSSGGRKFSSRSRGKDRGGSRSPKKEVDVEN